MCCTAQLESLLAIMGQSRPPCCWGPWGSTAFLLHAGPLHGTEQQPSAPGAVLQDVGDEEAQPGRAAPSYL